MLYYGDKFFLGFLPAISSLASAHSYSLKVGCGYQKLEISSAVREIFVSVNIMCALGESEYQSSGLFGLSGNVVRVKEIRLPARLFSFR